MPAMRTISENLMYFGRGEVERREAASLEERLSTLEERLTQLEGKLPPSPENKG